MVLKSILFCVYSFIFANLVYKFCVRKMKQCSWALPSSKLKWHLNRFSRFCRLTSVTDQQMYLQTTLLGR